MRLLIALAAPLVLALPLSAQHPMPAQKDSARPATRGAMMRDGMHHEMMSEMMAPMMRAMAFTPAHLLERKDVLALTPQQVTRLTTLRDEAKRAHDAAAAQAKQHRDALGQALQGSDTAAIRTHFQAMHAAMGTAHWTMLRAVAQSRAILNDAQRGRVDGWADAMQMHQRMQRDEQEHEGHDRP